MARSWTGATLAALLAAVLATAQCAPSSGDARTSERSRGELSFSTAPPQWHNPCGVMAKSAPRAHKQHVNGSGSNQTYDQLEQVRRQLNRAHNSLRRLWPSITKFYRQVKTFPKIPIDWLEFNHFEWYNKTVIKLELNEKTGMVLRKMHDSMQKMMASIDSLLKYRAFGQHLAPRTNILSKVQGIVNEILCESEEAIVTLNVTMPEYVSRDVVAWDTGDSLPDDTHLQLMDWGVLKKLRPSVKDWKQVLKNMLKGRPKGRGKNASKSKNHTVASSQHKTTPPPSDARVTAGGDQSRVKSAQQ